jgi:hypothetical protein
MQQNTTPNNDREKILIEKIRTLSPEKVIQVADFVDFLSHKGLAARLYQLRVTGFDARPPQRAPLKDQRNGSFLSILLNGQF